MVALMEMDDQGKRGLLTGGVEYRGKSRFVMEEGKKTNLVFKMMCLRDIWVHLLGIRWNYCFQN